MDTGLIIILSICAAGLFAVVLASRMRKDTKSTSNVVDDTLNYGRGNVGLSALRAEKTGLSLITVCMLTAVAIAVMGGGIAVLYYHFTLGLILIGTGMVTAGSVTIARYMWSLQNAHKTKTSWVMLVNKKDSPQFWFVYIVMMAVGCALILYGLILEVQAYKELTPLQASLRVLIPGVLIMLLSYWRVKKATSAEKK